MLFTPSSLCSPLSNVLQGVIQGLRYTKFKGKGEYPNQLRSYLATAEGLRHAFGRDQDDCSEDIGSGVVTA